MDNQAAGWRQASARTGVNRVMGDHQSFSGTTSCADLLAGTIRRSAAETAVTVSLRGQHQRGLRTQSRRRCGTEGFRRRPGTRPTISQPPRTRPRCSFGGHQPLRANISLKRRPRRQGGEPRALASRLAASGHWVRRPGDKRDGGWPIPPGGCASAGPSPRRVFLACWQERIGLRGKHATRLFSCAKRSDGRIRRSRDANAFSGRTWTFNRSR